MTKNEKLQWEWVGNIPMKKIPGYPEYLIHRHGKVWSKRKKCFMKLQKNRVGYLRIELCSTGNPGKRRKAGFNRGVRLFVHRLVGEAYVKNNDPLKYEINHDRFDIEFNAWWNLTWMTRSENMKWNRHRWKYMKTKGDNGVPCPF